MTPPGLVSLLAMLARDLLPSEALRFARQHRALREADAGGHGAQSHASGSGALAAYAVVIVGAPRRKATAGRPLH